MHVAEDVVGDRPTTVMDVLFPGLPVAVVIASGIFLASYHVSEALGWSGSFGKVSHAEQVELNEAND